jgi:2'-5' RNA ligase
MRCFLALPLLEPALDDAQRALSLLQRQIGAVRWARPETLHLTVHFFADVSDAKMQTALTAVAPVVARAEPFEIALDKLGSFPPRGWPRVLWLGASHVSPEVPAFAQRCRSALAEAGFAVDDRPFTAHCTLGRPRTPWPREARDAWEAAVKGYQQESRFVADRLVLYESTIAPGGAIYTERASHRLQGLGRPHAGNGVVPAHAVAEV